MTCKRTGPSSPIRSTSPSPADQSQTHSKDPDRLLPIANVSRLMKKYLPTNAKVSKEAKETVQECVSEFISFITGEASDKCQREKRKTIIGDDILWAMTTLGFENYVATLKIRDLEGEAANDIDDDQQQKQQQLNIMNGQMSVGNVDKVFNFGGNNKREFHDGHLGAEDFDKVCQL
ncbi:unnamed protein product [Rhodiola kirilowii]